MLVRAALWGAILGFIGSLVVYGSLEKATGGALFFGFVFFAARKWVFRTFWK